MLAKRMQKEIIKVLLEKALISPLGIPEPFSAWYKQTKSSLWQGLLLFQCKSTERANQVKNIIAFLCSLVEEVSWLPALTRDLKLFWGGIWFGDISKLHVQGRSQRHCCCCEGRYNEYYCIVIGEALCFILKCMAEYKCLYSLSAHGFTWVLHSSFLPPHIKPIVPVESFETIQNCHWGNINKTEAITSVYTSAPLDQVHRYSRMELHLLDPTTWVWGVNLVTAQAFDEHCGPPSSPSHPVPYNILWGKGSDTDRAFV